MTLFRRPARAPDTPRVLARQPADTLVMPTAEGGTEPYAGGYQTGFTTVIRKHAPRRPAARLGLSVTAAASGTVVASILSVPSQLRIAAAIIGAALPAFMTEPGRFQRQRIFAAGLLTVAALFVTYGGTTALSYFAGKPAAHLDRPATALPGPWAVIKAYYNDITLREYPAAWRLLGPVLREPGYARWVTGYGDTGRQILKKIGVSGDQISFTLRSDNPDGTVQTYSGTDTVSGGKIIHAHVVLTGGPA